MASITAHVRLLDIHYLALLVVVVWAVLWSWRARALVPAGRRWSASLLRAALFLSITPALAGLAWPVPTLRHTVFAEAPASRP